MDDTDFTYCKICQISLTGKMQALQHYAGEKHKKHQSQQNSGMLAEMSTRSTEYIPEEGAEFMGERGFCHVCNKELTSRVVYEQHMAGRSHKKLYDRWKKMTSSETCQIPTIVGILSSGGLSDAVTLKDRGLKLNVAATSKDSQYNRKCYSFNFDNKFGFCQACGTTFTDFLRFQDHLKTDDHKKREEEFESNKGKPAVRATPSSIDLKGSNVNVQSLQVSLARLAKGINPADNTDWFYCKFCEKHVNTCDQLRKHEQSPRHKNQVKRYRAGVKRYTAEQTIWHICPTCQKKVNSAEQLKIHMKSHTSMSLLAEDHSDGFDSTTRECFTSCYSSEESEDSEEANICDDDGDDDAPKDVHINKAWHPYKCDTCGNKFTGEKPYLQHLESKMHKKKLQQQELGIGEGTGTASPYRFHCHMCDAYFCTERDRQAHYEGKKHSERAIKEIKVPERPRPHIKKNESCEELNLIEYVPHRYQVELYKQAMLRDTVCFLPTGTGKTLVAVMVLSHMLKLNPYHSAVFLVDKILLGFQQYEVILNQIGKKLYHRYDADKEKTVERTLNVALVCSGRQDTVNNMPLWKHDVIVATAAYYENLLDNKALIWEHNCLVILDESHHCTKEHPYSKLMVNYHHPLKEALKPKILGLTASPAGKSSFEKTMAMMKELLKKLGSVHLVTSESEELQSYCSTTQLIIKKVNLTEGEKTLRAALRNHLVKCYEKLKEYTDIGKYIENKTLDDCDDNAMGDIIMSIAEDFRDLMSLVSSDRRENDLQIAGLKEHTVIIADAVLAVSGIGLHYACHCLKKLADDNFIGNFSHLAGFQLDCSHIKQLVARYDKIKPDGMLEEQDEFPIVKQLIHDIITEVDWDADVEPKPLVLLMVRQRNDAKIFRRILENSTDMRAKNIKVVSVVGHGSSKSRGMTVKKQDVTFREIMEHKYQVIVATSVAEEGIDIPECELVVQMDPPTNVKSLVQIRGRARKRNSKFIALCRDQKQVEALEALQKQEAYMIQAAKAIVAEQSLN